MAEDYDFVVGMTGFVKNVRGGGRKLRHGLRLRAAVVRAALRHDRRLTEPVGTAQGQLVSAKHLISVLVYRFCFVFN